MHQCKRSRHYYLFDYQAFVATYFVITSVAILVALAVSAHVTLKALHSDTSVLTLFTT